MSAMRRTVRHALYKIQPVIMPDSRRGDASGRSQCSGSRVALAEQPEATLMHRTQLWTVFAPAPLPVETWAGRTAHNYRVCRNFIKSSAAVLNADESQLQIPPGW